MQNPESVNQPKTSCPMLYGIGGPAKGRKVVLGRNVISVGRREDMTVAIVDPKLSGHHADIITTDGSCVLRDCMSTNGTYVNGVLATEATLTENDRIRMGRCEFVFTTLSQLDQLESAFEQEDTVELVHDGGTSVIGMPKVQMSLVAQSVQAASVWGDGVPSTAHKLCSLYEIARRINVLSELDSLLDLVVNTILDEMAADRAVLLLREEKSGELKPAVAKCRTGLGPARGVQISETIVRQAAESRQSILTEDAGRDDRFAQGESITIVGIRSAMCVPLVANDKVVGVAYVDKLSATTAFEAGDLEFLTVLCNSAAISIENARLFSEVQARNREVTEAHHQLEASFRQLEETQQKLIQAEKLSSLGRLVAGIAHDLKNILTSVTGYAQLLKLPSTDEKRATYVERLNETTSLCSKMVRDLMSFARQEEVRPEPSRLDSLLHEALEIVRSAADAAGVELVIDVAEDLPRVTLDKLQVMRVLTNLMTNAIQAMAAHDEPRCLTVRVAQVDEWVHIDVADTGPGIPNEIIGKIFDPFFTTKPKGQGTGLGLSLCQGIVAAHGGEISVESSPSQGTCFTIQLPIGGLAAAIGKMAESEEEV